MIYASPQEAQRDIVWLTQECSLGVLAASRLPLYELEILQESITNSIEDKDILHFYDNFFELYGLQKTAWSTSILPQELPVLALIPRVGLLVIVEHDTIGSWKCEGIDGVTSIGQFPKGTMFTPLKSERKTFESYSAKSLFKRVALRQKPIIIYAAIASLGINFLAIGTSLFSMQVYDRVIPTEGISTLVALSIGVFIAILLELIVKLSRSSILDYAVKNMDAVFSHDIFNRFLKIRLDMLPKSVGTLSGQLQSYVSIRAFISTAALYLLIDLPFSMIFLAVIVLLSGLQMGLVVLVFFVLSLMAGLFFRKKIERLTTTSSMAANRKLGLLVESVDNAENIKATGAGWSLLNRWNSLTEDGIYDDIEIRHYSEMATYFSAFLQQLSYISLVALGAYLVTTTSDLTMGGLIAVTILSGRVLNPISMLPNLLVQWGRTKIAIEDLDRVYALERDNEGIDAPLTPALLEPSFGCKNLVFAYGEDTPAVVVGNLHIAAGERVAIVGTIGSGKSTLLKLLAGLYKPQTGKILMGGIDMQQIARSRLSERIAYLPQNTKLISGTLRENLLLGLVGVSDEKIIEIAHKTSLINLLNALPLGLDTPIPEGGESVSGGQKQIIALTRLLLMQSVAVFLDEPTANMDDQTERKLMQAIQEHLKPDDTLVLVTHKPALLALVNRIIVVGPQKIVLDGPKEAVLAQLSSGVKIPQQG
jgi:ATP-binding cassette subfamily C protein LapB